MTPKSQLEAVIWDMDGVIVDTALYHLKAWQNVFQEKSITFTESDFRQSFRQRNDAIIKSVLGAAISPDEIKAVASKKETDFRFQIGQDIKLLPGVVKLILALGKRGVKMALASSAPRENIQLIFARLGIENCFQAIVNDNDVSEGKPNPQVFLLAAQRLDAAPKKCVAIEDAIAGVTAAKRAGMYCVAVTTTNPREHLMEADLVVESLESVAVNDLEALVDPGKPERGVRMERSLVLVKPDAVQRRLTGAIIARLEEQGLKLVAIKMLQMDKTLAQRHYAVHANKPFFNSLVSYISSAPIIALVFEGEKAVEVTRKAMGATDPAKAESGTIRGDFGLSIEQNTVHGSDSVETAEKEIRLFFTEAEIF